MHINAEVGFVEAEILWFRAVMVAQIDQIGADGLADGVPFGRVQVLPAFGAAEPGDTRVIAHHGPAWRRPATDNHRDVELCQLLGHLHGRRNRIHPATTASTARRSRRCAACRRLGFARGCQQRWRRILLRLPDVPRQRHAPKGHPHVVENVLDDLGIARTLDAVVPAHAVESPARFRGIDLDQYRAGLDIA